MNTKGALFAGVLALALMVAASGARAAGATPLETFFGSYEGESISSGDEGLSKRDLGVQIAPIERGFRLSWVTVKRRVDGSRQRKSYTIDFRDTQRPGVYGSQSLPEKFMFWSSVLA